MSELEGRTIVVTGGTGSLGSRLVKKILNEYNPKEIRVFSRSEREQVFMAKRLNDVRCKFIIGDVRDWSSVRNVCLGANIVLHTAAMKHVPICENQPSECILTNIIGTKNVVNAAVEVGVEKMVFVSTDKAASPSNVYGWSKVLGERLVIEGNDMVTGDTELCCVRFGNMLGSQGSVIDLFKNQMEKQGEITVTDPTMTRFFITIDQAVNHILKSIELCRGGEIFIPNMSATSVGTLVEALIGDSDIEIKIIGARPGEKHFEHIISKDERRRVKVVSDSNTIAIMSRWIESDDYYKEPLFGNEMTSLNVPQMDKDEVTALLNEMEKENEKNA